MGWEVLWVLLAWFPHVGTYIFVFVSSIHCYLHSRLYQRPLPGFRSTPDVASSLWSPLTSFPLTFLFRVVPGFPGVSLLVTCLQSLAQLLLMLT